MAKQLNPRRNEVPSPKYPFRAKMLIIGLIGAGIIASIELIFVLIGRLCD